MDNKKEQRTTGNTYCARKASLGLRQIFRLATLGAYHFFRRSSYRMTVGKSERTQSLRLDCAPSSWAAVKLYVSPTRTPR